MKKILSFFCALLIVFSLCSCEKHPQNNNIASYENATSSSTASALDNSDLSLNKSFSDKSSSSNSTDSSKSSSLDNISSQGNVTSSSSKTSSNSTCKHSYAAPTCYKPSLCKKCGVILKSALGHSFSDGYCTRPGCSYKQPDWIDWYTRGNISITKAEVKQIVSMEYKKPKNVIVMIGDGMGPNDIELAEKNNEGCFDFGLVLNQIKYTGFATTHSNNSSVTDSAASGTALATGHKTNNGYIGVSPSGSELKNISEIARENGKLVGIVTNDDIVGATPSAFTVHNISRSNSYELAESFVKFKPDVLIGQGYRYFSSLNLSSFLYSNSISTGFDKFNRELNNDPHCKQPFIGFFVEDILSKKNNTLAYCTEIALNRLKNDSDGFFLMVENAATDKAGHNNDINGKINGVINFDRAVATVLKFMKNNPDTLLIITSDHETGGVQLPQGDFVLNNSLFTTKNHTATNVRTFALGCGAEYFDKVTVDNTDIAKFAINAIVG